MRNYALEIVIRQIKKIQELVKDYLYLEGADLSNANLSWANLSNADLTGADLSGADLRCADLSNADLTGADLSGADLRWSDLSGADLSGADLSNADLRSAALTGAYLRCANLSNANLINANLFCADLSNANLSYSYLRDADLLSVKLTGTILTGTGIQTTFEGVLPSTDLSLFAAYEEDSDFVVGYRTSKSIYVGNQTYEVGKEYCAPYLFTDTRTECGLGLYLYPTVEEAKELAIGHRCDVIKVVALRKETIKAGRKYRTKRFLVLETV